MTFPASTRGLYAILDPEQTLGRDPLSVAESILDARPAVLQLRAKNATDATLRDLGREVRTLCHRAGVPFVMNDRADLARLLDADGVHLGQDDLPIAAARRVVGSMPLGRSTHSLAQAMQAVAEGADLIGFGPVFDTATKQNPDPTTGLALLAEVVRAVSVPAPVPVVGIGGITLSSVPSLHATGCALIAVIGAIGRAEDPKAATEALVRAWESC